MKEGFSRWRLLFTPLMSKLLILSLGMYDDSTLYYSHYFLCLCSKREVSYLPNILSTSGGLARLV